MRVALIGTRGVPAHYGGFETAIEEVGQRLVERGHEVVVYCRGGDDPDLKTYLGMQLVHLPAARKKALETLSHTALSTGHLWARGGRLDAAIVFNAANAPFVPALRARGIPVAVHVDGLEWRRDKWTGAGQRYYRTVEGLSVRWADALIADAQGIADYYTDEFGADTELLAYGAPILESAGSGLVAEMGLFPRGYHLVVARFEPENHVREIVAGYDASEAALPLVVVGSAPYAGDYTARIDGMASSNPRIHLLGGVWEQQRLDELYANALTYLHGHSVGGTNPSLLRAMGAGTAVVAFDVSFNREVLGGDGRFFAGTDDIAGLLSEAEHDPTGAEDRGRRLRDRAAENYRWDDVTLGYEKLLERLAGGWSARPGNKQRWRRRGASRDVPATGR